MKLPFTKKFIFKIIVSALFIWWIVHNQKISLENVKLGFSDYKLLSVFLLLYLCQLMLASVRTRHLIADEENTLSIANIFSISWASLFLNCISPSSLVGEIFRIKKMIDIAPNTTKDNFIYASIFSKIFSTLSLLILSTGASFYLVKKIPKFSNLLLFSYIALGIIFLCMLKREKIFQLLRPLFEIIYNRIRSKFFLKRMDNFKSYCLNLSRRRKIWLIGFTTSFIIQLLNSLTFIFIIFTINPKASVSFLELLSVVPLGIFIMTLPISYLGIGVGHLAFDSILRLFNIHNGADVFTIFLSISFILDITGVIFFFKLINTNLKSFVSTQLQKGINRH